MKVGDLVKIATRDEHIGVIVNTWKNHKNHLQSVDVLLECGTIKNVGTWACKALNESR
jgi:hypothetical protein